MLVRFGNGWRHKLRKNEPPNKSFKNWTYRRAIVTNYHNSFEVPYQVYQSFASPKLLCKISILVYMGFSFLLLQQRLKQTGLHVNIILIGEFDVWRGMCSIEL